MIIIQYSILKLPEILVLFYTNDNLHKCKFDKIIFMEFI